MIRTTLLSLTLIGCNSFDAQENSGEPTNPSYKIIDASDSINVDPEKSDFTTPNSVVMTIPELGLEVIEQEPEIDLQPDSEHPDMLEYEQPEQADDSVHDVVDDELIKFVEVETLLPESDLTAELTAERPIKIVAVSTFPTPVLDGHKTQHSLKILHPEERAVYTSELLQSIVIAVQQEIDALYIPLTAEIMPDILFEGVEYAQSEGIQVYDANGNEL